MGSVRKYPNKYRPRICTSRLIMYYYKKADEDRVFLPKGHKRKVGVKEIEIDFAFTILNQEDESPTERMYNDLIERNWKEHGPKKANYVDYEVFIHFHVTGFAFGMVKLRVTRSSRRG